MVLQPGCRISACNDERMGNQLGRPARGEMLQFNYKSLAERGSICWARATDHVTFTMSQLHCASPHSMTPSPRLPAPRFIRLEHLGVILFDGADAQSFLNAQLTSDLHALAAERCQYSGYCTPKGRLLATFLLWRREHSFCLQLPAVLQEPLRKQLSRFILRSEVTISSAGSGWLHFGVVGSNAGILLAQVLGGVPAVPGEVRHSEEAIVIRLPVDRYLVAVAADRANALEVALAGHGLAPAGTDLWRWLDISAGVPVIMPATQEEFVPQMVNLDLIGGVSFTKGCYPGQEIVARMHYLGRLKQRMYRFHVESAEAPRPGDKLYSTAFEDQAWHDGGRGTAARGSWL
jgi:folate-binding protein YgfZ